MREHGFAAHYMEPERVEWITAADEQKPALILKMLLKVETDALPQVSEKDRLAFAAVCWSICKKLHIFGLENCMNYCMAADFCGVYYHMDIRFGNNLALAQNLSIPEGERIDKLNMQCWTVYRKFVTNDTESFLFNAAQRFVHTDISTSLPMEIDSPVRFAEGFCRTFWPEFIDIMPQHYFPRIGMDIQVLCDRYGLTSPWDVTLCIAAAAVLGQFFMKNPCYGKFHSMLLNKTGLRLQGRDKAIDILMTLKDWLQTGYWEVK